MEIQVVSIFDSKTGAYLAPVFVRSIGQAHRWFQEQIQDPNSQQGKFPDDYALMHLGRFDDETGSLESIETGPTIIIAGHQLASLIKRQQEGN